MLPKLPKDQRFRVLYDRDHVMVEIRCVARKIGHDYRGREVTLVCVLKGGAFFANHLATAIEDDGRVTACRLEYVSVSSYEDGKESGTLRFEMELRRSVTGQHVIVVDDVAETCKTLEHVVAHVNAQRPASLRVAVLIEKPEKTLRKNVTIDYAAFRRKKAGWIVGCGMDHEGQLRGYPAILRLE